MTHGPAPMTHAVAVTKYCLGPPGCGRLDVDFATTNGITTSTVTQRWCVGAACMAWQPDAADPDRGDCLYRLQLRR